MLITVADLLIKLRECNDNNTNNKNYKIYCVDYGALDLVNNISYDDGDDYIMIHNTYDTQPQYNIYMMIEKLETLSEDLTVCISDAGAITKCNSICVCGNKIVLS